MIGVDTQRVLPVAAGLLSAGNTAARAAIIADAITQQAVPDSACILYSSQTQDGELYLVPIAVSGDVAPAAEVLKDRPQIFPSGGKPLLYNAVRLQREEYAHLLVTRTVRGLAYFPLAQGAFAGVIEILAFGGELEPEQIAELQPLANLAATALAASEAGQGERQELLDSIHRLTQLYDLEKSLNSTLELDALMDLIPAKVFDLIPSQAVHLWMFDGDDLKLMSRFGTDETIEVGSTEKLGEGYVAEMAEEGVPTVIDDPGDPRLKLRNEKLSGADAVPIRTALLAPLLQDGAEIGVVEAVNKITAAAFDDDDLFFLNTMAETISSSLKNASLLVSERKLEILETLVHVSSEITSTLRIERLLQIIVNSPQSVLPYERCAIALDQRGRLQLKAVSGMATIPAGDTSVEHLRAVLSWLSNRYEPLLVRQHKDEPEHSVPEEREYLKNYFQQTGYRAIYALPLNDDQGRLGLLLYESSDPDFLETAHIEMIKVLVGQATVATRNALLYREVPLIQFLEPLMQRKHKLRQSKRERLLVRLGIAALAVAFLTFVPLPMRLSGTAIVAPQHIVTIAAPVEGNVSSVLAREGERVAAGQVLGGMDDWAWRADVASAQSRYQATLLAMENDLAEGSPKAGQDRAQADYLQAELRHAQLRLSNAELRSPIAGVVITPDLQNAAGEHLDAGATFAQVLDLSSAVVNVAIDEADVPLVRPGQSVAIKFESFPARTWHGQVSVVSPEAQSGDGERFFYARIPLDNSSAVLRAGMEGHGKIWGGFHPAGYVLLRRPALWVWSILWNWIGW